MATLAVKIDPTGATAGSRQVVRSMDDIKKAAVGVDRATGNLGRVANDNLRKVSASAQVATASFNSMKSALAGLAGAMVAAFSVTAVVRAADSYTRLNNSLKLAGATGQNLIVVQDRLFAAANRNGVEIETLGQLYMRASVAAKELGASQEDLLKFIDGVTAAVRVQGGSAAAASGALLQLSQALGAGVVRAEEFNSILEGAYPIAQAAARGIAGMGGSVAKLRAAILAGEITSKEFFEGLLKGFTATEAAAAGMTLTVGGALTAMGNSWTRMIGQLDEATGASQLLVSAILLVGKAFDGVSTAIEAVIANLDTIAVAAGTFLTIMSPVILAGIAAGFVAIGKAGVAAFTAIGVAIAANPLGALAIGITAAITALYYFRDEVKQALGVDVVQIAKDAGNAIISAFVAAYHTVRITWNFLPQVLGDIIYSAADWVINGVEELLNAAIERIELFVDAAGVLLTMLGYDVDKTATQLGKIDLPNITNPYAGATDDWAKSIKDMFGEVFSSDWIGAWQKKIEEAFRSGEEAADGLDEKLDGLPGAMDKAGLSADELKAKFKAFQSVAEGLAEKMFPAEYARKEAAELMALLDQFGSKLTALERIAVRAEIGNLLTAADLGLRRLEENTESTAQKMGSLFGEVGTILAGIFDQPIESLWDFVDEVVAAIGQIGQKLMGMYEFDWAKAFGGKGGGGGTKGVAAQIAANIPSSYIGSPAHGARGASELQGYSAAGITGASFDVAQARTAAGNSVPVQVWNFFQSKGLASHQIAGIMGNVRAESAFNASAIGDAGLAQGLFQHHSARRNGSFALGDAQSQLDLAWRELQSSENTVLKNLMRANTVAEATAAFIGFERPAGWKADNPTAGHNWSGRLTFANQAMAQFGNGSTITPTAANQNIAPSAPATSAPSSGLGTSSGSGGTFQKFAAGAGALASGFASGYNAQNPLMGAISGGLGAIGTGDPLAIGLGILGGFIGGIIGLKKAIDEARAELDKLRPEMETFFKVGAGEGVSSMAESLREYTDQAREYAKIADKARDFETLDKLREAVVAFEETLKGDFRLGFEATLASLSSGQGLDGELVQAQQAVLSLREELKAFIADAEFSGVSGDRARQAGQMQLLAMLDGGAEKLSDVAFEMARLETILPSVRQSIKDLGGMGRSTEAVIRERLVTAIGALRDSFEDDLTASINELSGRGYLNEIAAAQERYNARLSDAAALGLDASGAQEELALALLAIQKNAGATAEELTAFAQATQITGDSLRSFYRDMVEGAAATLRQTLDVWRDFVDGIAEYRKGLNLNPSLSTLSPSERLAAARSAFEATSAAAMTGDRDAMGRLQSDASAYLEQAATFWSSSEQYASIFSQVQATLASVEGNAANQITLAEQSLSYAEQNVAGLTAANDNLMTLVQSSEALRSAVDAYLGVGGTMQTSISDMAAVAIAAAQSSTALVTQSVSDIAGALASRGAVQEPTLRERKAELERQAQATQNVTLGTENKGFFQRVGDWFADLLGFDAGGWTGNMGTSAVAGVVHGQEYVVPAPYAAKYRPLLEDMSAGRNIGREPANDDNRELARILRTGFENLNQTQERVAQLAAAMEEQLRQSREDANYRSLVANQSRRS